MLQIIIDRRQNVIQGQNRTLSEYTIDICDDLGKDEREDLKAALSAAISKNYGDKFELADNADGTLVLRIQDQERPIVKIHLERMVQTALAIIRKQKINSLNQMDR